MRARTQVGTGRPHEAPNDGSECGADTNMRDAARCRSSRGRERGADQRGSARAGLIVVVCRRDHTRGRTGQHASAGREGRGGEGEGVAGAFDTGEMTSHIVVAAHVEHRRTCHTRLRTQWGAAPHRPGRCQGRALALGLDGGSECAQAAASGRHPVLWLLGLLSPLSCPAPACPAPLRRASALWKCLSGMAPSCSMLTASKAIRSASSDSMSVVQHRRALMRSHRSRIDVRRRSKLA